VSCSRAEAINVSEVSEAIPAVESSDFIDSRELTELTAEWKSLELTEREEEENAVSYSEEQAVVAPVLMSASTSDEVGRLRRSPLVSTAEK
jgi:hypothetical protein